MTLTYGFYNSSSGDRAYDAIQISRIFDGIIADGVYATIGNYFLVSANTGMNLNVGTGRAWFNHTWTYNDAPVSVTIPTAHATLPRIDIVYLEVNEDTAVRANKVDVLQGTPASSPVAPTLTNTATIHQYPLAHVYVGAVVSSIIQANITNKVGTSSCPFVTGIIDTIDTNDLLIEWEAEFYDWFNYLIGQLDTEVAGNLQNQITAIRGDNNPPLITILQLKTHDHDGGDTTQIPTEGLANNSVDDTKVGNRVPQFYRRQGASSTDWSESSTTPSNYIPGAVRQQRGVVRVGLFGSYRAQKIITFPQAYSYPPLVMATPKFVVGYVTTTGWTATVITTTATTVSIQVEKVDGSANSDYVDIIWDAVGPE